MAEEDPVVCEIPVHLADFLRGNLHVFQYPLRPVYRGMLNRPASAKYKPENAMVTLEFPVNTETNYNSEDHTPLPPMLPLTSSVVTPVSNYAAGVFRKGQLHLTPVSTIMQLRPSLQHLDESDDEASDDDMADVETDKKAEATPDVKEVQVQFKKRQSERALAAMQSSYAYKRGLIQSEKWIPLRVVSEDEDKDEFEQLFSETEAPVEFDVTPAAYLRALSYRNGDDVGTPSLTSDDVDMVGNDDLDKKVLDILTTDKVLHWKELRSLLPVFVTTDELRACVDRVATIVRGCLLPKSTLLKTHVAYRSLLADEFQKSASISRSEFAEAHGVPADIAKSLLQEYAVLNPATRLWQLKRADDNVQKWQ
ncbi:hypothetical protein SPRG_11152 [Saprolegnia parasitica CBS 223.65]|uniref:DNA-directed RNA polymerase III subunit RPC5 n=1 Tax=Saprolegnia parasitica (strain CBS 223.65) TaxID=695850 RepID=A0A067C288_SAPPC|nr:hypothetical protein SPRG_11152 [Saprolegnia parasitica CBS 223.65]KDO23220.1 hypothetical protein SPRG_11152 [Saprolegnia parasitica CBS 223.65]|eukprot:XP_012206018.1 hypothetical protein SPRG_11152 [Saprolegnia parasitica CBS 223.65]